MGQDTMYDLRDTRDEIRETGDGRGEKGEGRGEKRYEVRCTRYAVILSDPERSEGESKDLLLRSSPIKQILRLRGLTAASLRMTAYPVSRFPSPLPSPLSLISSASH